MDFGLTLQKLIEEVLLFLPRLITALVIFIAGLILSGLAARAVKRALHLRTEDPELTHLMTRLARWTVIILGVIVALDQVDFDVTSFIAGLGIVGVTLGFALQDIARNFVAGILLLIRQPLEIGDVVQVGDYTGTVKEITIRDTVIETRDGEMVIVPNIDVFTNAIINYSTSPNRRRTVQIGLGYDEDVGAAQALFLETLGQVDGVLADPAPVVLAEGLGDSALTLAAYFWVNQQTHDLFGVHSAVVQAIKEAAEREGIDLPYPIQTVRLEGDLSPLAPAGGT